MDSRKALRIALVVAAIALASCGGGDADDSNGDDPAGSAPVAPEQVQITVSDTAFEMPEELEAEPVSLTVQNEGKDPHITFFARLNEGSTQEDIDKAIAKNVDALFPHITLAGNMEKIEPNASTEVTMDFPEGDYLVIDPEVSGDPLYGFFSVVGATGPDVETPTADYSIETGEFYFKISEPVAGEATIAISNVGEQSHEVGIGKGPGGEDGEVTTIFAPAPGGTMWTTLDLKPGDYTLVCFLPDPRTEKTHIKLGMEQEFSVE